MVKIIGNVNGQGKSGKVIGKNLKGNSFFAVQIGKNNIGIYHVSDLKVIKSEG